MEIRNGRIYLNDELEILESVNRLVGNAKFLKPKRRPVREPVRMSTKVGRNDLCPCGSGKKFKKCCLPNYLREHAEEISR
jgi:uncharacterized protein YecA (UPF0149 family)